jgi:hypothetical protein
MLRMRRRKSNRIDFELLLKGARIITKTFMCGNTLMEALIRVDRGFHSFTVLYGAGVAWVVMRCICHLNSLSMF